MKLSIPPSNSTVDVSVIDAGYRVSKIPPKAFLEPVYPQFQEMSVPALCFLLEHGNQKYLFDLGIRKDWENLPPAYLDRIRKGVWDVTSPGNVKEVLEKGKVPSSAISGIIWSHWHWDHTGDPSTFPSETELVVGPGFCESFLPAYPSNPLSRIDEKAFTGRKLREISFENSIKVAGYDAIDFFDDGSLYLLDTPGHAIGHISALARTTPDTFILMGADTCHHGGVLRPSSHVSMTQCPGHLKDHVDNEHPTHDHDQPFFTLPNVPDGTGVTHVRSIALESISRLTAADAEENILVVVAHDHTVLDVVETFPRKANDWKAKGWKERTRWLFLNDLISNKDIMTCM